MNYETTVDASSSAPLSGEEHLLAVGQEEAARRRKLIILAIIAIIAVLIAVILLTRGGKGDSTAQQGTQTPAVSVIAPGRAAIQGTIQATGTLAARRELPVGVVGEGGRVVSVPVDAGQWVRAGQVLAVIDRSVQVQQAASSAANIEVTRADARLAQANLDRALQLVERGFISKADIDRLTATRDAAVARVRVAEAQYGERNARNAQLNIVAPAAGLLLKRSVEPGQVVSPGSGTLFSIAKDGQLELLALVGETELAKLSDGVTAQVVPVGTDKAFTGQVWQVSPVIDQQTRQGTARIALSYAPELRPGGFATATIESGTVVAPMLPESAILNDSQGRYVYIVGKGNKVERRAVKTGLVTENGLAIVEGLDGSEKVVLRAGGFLAPGDEVRPHVVKK
ncbi:efflux RND transporter periplasmic adaptor subunit [Altererythrobacter sp. CC-YST694]|uniref:efflux RND transporter periplasmic adaptor subunit n=1 Tax=Altererythrobacter sp. CC-YST694 TaxID=2755038 RepID=UPI001D01B306|nr:efflux RND transporter periplasmic adaptor subunit [Altererythrobacter sp. CC-YST694]MCB5425315.1 efflux RND transporter periplasmic adaptor subunit [Altererythrobacter sp. CC-YST694]